MIDKDVLQKAVGGALDSMREQKRAKKAKRFAKWTQRASEHGVTYADLSKSDRALFRAQFKADLALQKLQKTLDGSDGRKLHKLTTFQESL